MRVALIKSLTLGLANGLVHYRDNWYLDAWCHMRRAVRSCAAAHRLLDVGRDASEGKVIDIPPAKGARRYADYSVAVHADRMPKGVELWRWDFTRNGLKKV